MATKFVDFLTQDLPAFESSSYYEPITDSLILYCDDKRSYAKRISKYFTLFLANDDDTFVGFEIKGVKDICKAIGSDGMREIVKPMDVNFEDGSCELSVMVKVATISSEVDLNAEEYQSLERASRGRRFQRDTLQSC